MIPGWLPLVIWFLPLATALIVSRVAWSRAALAHGVAASAMGVTTLLSIWLAKQVVSSDHSMIGPHVKWLDLGSIVLGFGVYLDPMGAVMTVIVCLLATLVLLFNAWYARR